MFKGFLEKYFPGSKAEAKEPDHQRATPLRLAVEKGFITEDQACELERDMTTGDLDPEETHSDLMIDRGLISGSQAKVIAIDVKKQDPKQAQDDAFRQAARAMAARRDTAEEVGTKTAGIRLADVATAKKA